MPRNGDEIDLKRRARRRLVGAIALALLLVIVPPWIMEREPRSPVSSLSVEIPSQTAKPPVAAVPAPATTRKEPDERQAAASAVDSAGKAAQGEVAAPASSESSKPKPTPAPASAPAKDKPKTAASERSAPSSQGGYMVPLGAFANEDNARQLQEKVGAAGIKTFTEPLKTAGATHTRVRAGPFETREAAEKAREKLKGLGIDPGAVMSRQ